MNFFRSERGGAAVEFAILAPILALIVSGIIEMSNLVQAANVASNAAREGARYASVGRVSQVCSVVSTYLNNGLVSRIGTSVVLGTVQVTANGTTSTCSGGTLSPVPTLPLGNDVTVTAPVTVTFAMPFIHNLFPNGIAMNSSAEMEVTAITQ